MFRIVKVVHRLVEQRAAPAANACRAVADVRLCRQKAKAIGELIPVKATSTERPRFDFRDLKLVFEPPPYTRRISPRYPSWTMICSVLVSSHFALGVSRMWLMAFSRIRKDEGMRMVLMGCSW